jgi:S1-C subfamily serine protease
MKIRPNWLLVFSLLTALNSSALSQENVADVVKRSTDAVVLIVISDSSGTETTLGSGFLASADGEIVTNYHVIKDAHSAIVKLSNGAFFPVNGVLASDSDKDLAIVKVNGKNLPFLSLGELEKVQVGEHVVAIGSPLGLEGTVSDGIVSAIRDVSGEKWIQTTAPASHGNSGGPLLDMSNNVVGVITLGVNPDLGQNLNFAVPCNEVTAMLISARQKSQPLDSVGSNAAGAVSEGKLWTSLTNGRDYNLRQDGDYLYVDWIDMPPELKSAGGFIRAELTKSSDGTWKGVQHARLPCTYTRGYGAYAQTVTNSCSRSSGIEIHFVSGTRIEGSTTVPEKFNCSKCEPEGKDQQKPFTWIPK